MSMDEEIWLYTLSIQMAKLTVAVPISSGKHFIINICYRMNLLKSAIAIFFFLLNIKGFNAVHDKLA